MATATQTLTYMPWIIPTSNAQACIELDPYREHSVMHNGKDVAGNAQTETIFLAVQQPGDDDPSITGDYSSEENKFPLLNGVTVVIGPGVEYLHYIAEANDPSFSIMPGPSLLGKE